MTPPGTRTARSLLVALAATTAAATATAVPASASTDLTAQVSHPGSDALGSTVPRSGMTPALAETTPPPGVRGMDVSSHQGAVDWPRAYALGARYAYVKATESTTYTNPYFSQQYNGSGAVGMVRGAYHFALPNRSSGTAQADFFVDHGGRWSADGQTLPPLLDIEYNPYGANCYGLGHRAMSSWILAFTQRVRARTGRTPMIFTTTGWWDECTGSNPGFGGYPLFKSHWGSTPGAMPSGWTNYTMWQWASTGTFPGDQSVFRGTSTALHRFAATAG